MVFIILVAIFYWLSPHILRLLQGYLGQRLAFFGVMEPVLALLKLSSLLSIAVMAPYLLFRLSQGLVAVMGVSKKFSFLSGFFALILFYFGAAFCFWVTMPFGINFLLGYQSETIRPVISVGKFIDFIMFFLLGFGLIFELPLLMTIVCSLKLCAPESFEQKRRYAILVIAILAAILTPTPDVFNMALMGIPMYCLYEIGIISTKMVAIKKDKVKK